MRTQFAKLLKQLRKNGPEADVALVRKAYQEAVKAHEGQLRLSGEPYVMHSIAVARILASIGLDGTTVAAGLLHDVLEDTAVTRDELTAMFGETITRLVDGVTKIATLHVHSTAPTQEEKQAQNLRKMLVATAKDVRVILIRLADRLHNMRTIEYLPEEKIRRISRETLDIYAPLAHRLGIARWRWELEDHAFHQLNPVEYKELAAKVAMKRREREKELNETVAFLECQLADKEVPARVTGRPKHLYGIHQKMLQQGIDFDDVMDVHAVRIVTQTKGQCYRALGVVHNLWTPVPGRFKDYVAMPKDNLYQTIHTTVMRETARALEIQIRSEEMDRTAQEGIAAHWHYKEGGGKPDPKAEGQLVWLRQMYEWLTDADVPDELLDSVRRDFQVTDVYVFTPKGEVKELPSGATPLDFAYMIHSDVGNHCLGARVSGRIVPLRYNLQTGDVVEILTSKNQTPRRDWLDSVVTGRARTRIRQRLRDLGELERIEPAKPKPRRAPSPRPTGRAPTVRQVDDATREKLLLIEGSGGLAAQFAKCCNPMPGQAIMGYATKDLGITVHRADCRNFAKTKRDPDRIIQASWQGEGCFRADVRVTIGQRPNVLADITNAMRPMNIDITEASFRSDKNGKSFFDFVFETPDRDAAERVAQAVRTVAGVSDVRIGKTRVLARAR